MALRLISRVFSLAALFVAAAPVAGALDQSYGFVLAHDPTASLYTVPAPQMFGYNDGGKAIVIERVSTGRYQVTFPDLRAGDGAGGHVQVTADGAGPTSCSVQSWSATNQIQVRCRDAGGAFTDARFQLLYLRPEGYEDHYAYLWANDATAASYTPSSTYAYNPGGPSTITRLGTGDYSVDFGLWAADVALVTAYGPAAVRCVNESVAGPLVRVRCFDSAGAPADSRFTLLYMYGDFDSEGLAHAFADDAGAASYTPSVSYHPKGGAVTASRVGLGDYRLEWDGLEAVGIPLNGGNVQVSARAAVDRRCHTDGFPGNTITVRCFDSAGLAADAAYDALFLKPTRLPLSQSYGYALADQPSMPSYTADPAMSFNAAGGAVSIERLGTGSYAVTFPGLGSLGLDGGNAQVTAVDRGHGCRLTNFVLDVVSLNCFDASGSAADTEFSLLYWRPEAGAQGLAYAWVNDSVSATSTPLSFWSYNPTGGSVEAFRDATGVYRVRWADFGAEGHDGGNVQVSAYGPGSDVRCAVGSWGGDEVVIECADTTGNPTDTRFSVLWVMPEEKTSGVAYAWTNQQTNPFYSPPSAYSFSGTGGDIYARSYGTGEYDIEFYEFELGGVNLGNLQVSAYGSASVSCAADPATSVAYAVVDCTNESGVLANTRYSALWLKPVPVPEPDARAVLAAGGLLLMGLRRLRRSEP